MARPPAVAAIANRPGRDAQGLLSQAVARWRKAGLKVVGVLAEDSREEGQCSAAFLRDIASGQRFSIQLDAAPQGTSCHLDAVAVGRACATLLPQIATADIVVLSKFGKTEALGEGLWPAFRGAIEAGTPLLTTVSPKHEAALTAAAPDAVRLEADGGSIDDWWKAAPRTAG